MLVVIPTLTVNDPDVSLAIGARMIHNLAVKMLPIHQFMQLVYN